MHETFRAHVEALHPSFERLIAMTPVTVASLPSVMPERGVYVFSEGATHLYAGRSNRLRPRLREHGRPSSGHNTAPFAFQLARQETKTVATYRPTGSRSELEADPVFAAAFADAKRRVRAMDIRFVGEADPVRQALLEMYVAVALGTRFNDFNNH
jgi:hypothetical protein